MKSVSLSPPVGRHFLATNRWLRRRQISYGLFTLIQGHAFSVLSSLFNLTCFSRRSATISFFWTNQCRPNKAEFCQYRADVGELRAHLTSKFVPSARKPNNLLASSPPSECNNCYNSTIERFSIVTVSTNLSFESVFSARPEP